MPLEIPDYPFQAYIFDCDGTLADTMPLHWRAWNTITTRHGLHFPEERFYAMGGVPSRDILKLLRDEQGVNIDPLAVAHHQRGLGPALHVGQPPQAQATREHLREHLHAVDAEIEFVLARVGRPLGHHQRPGDQGRRLARPAGLDRQPAEVDVAAGRVLLEQGHSGTDAFVVLKGTFVARRNGRKVATAADDDPTDGGTDDQPDAAAGAEPNEGAGKRRRRSRANGAAEGGASEPEADADADEQAAEDELPTSVGRYQVLGKLGAGGMGTIYKCFDPKLRRTVAVKVVATDPDPRGHDELLRRFACEACDFSITKIPGSRSFELHEVERFLVDKKIGPLEGFRSKAGWPFTAELRLVFDDEISNWKLEFDFGEDDKSKDDGEPVDFSDQTSLGPCPKCQGHVYEHGSNYVCEHSVGAHTTCDFKTGKIILQQPVAREQMSKLLATGKTDLLENFVSNKTRRKFKAFLAYDKKEGKVGFEFEPRAAKVPAKKAAAKKAAA